MNSAHSFHIPVMGLAFTIDSPIKVARFGIPSVMSIIEDRLVETMRKYYYEKSNLKFKPITSKETDYRAKRITDYLNLVNRIVNEQMEKLRNSAFQTGSELVKYFELLPEESRLKQLYRRMIETTSENEKSSLEIFLRSQVKPGSIDVNIMTKLDKTNYDSKGAEIPDGSDALTALRGYAQSDLNDSAIVFSAGMNPRLFNYLETFSEFDPIDLGRFKKRIIVKVSDFRSALIQGKMLAKKGIWVSEFRIESGLNCGGHAFATDGYLLGPILEEFKQKREMLVDELHKLYMPAADSKGKPVYLSPHPIRISVQGGIGTAQEDHFLREHYNIDSTGWGTPFLLCPEATTVDDDTLKKLQEAKEKDVILSKSSPLGVRFHYLKGTTAELERQKRIDAGKPGSPCTEKHLISNTEFSSEPICTASHAYQTQKLEQLKSLDLTPAEYEKRKNDVLAKECLCVGLSNAVSSVYNMTFLKKRESVTICPGPNIAYFNSLTTLQEMVDHIYGRKTLPLSKNRPHMFVKELELYVNYFEELIETIDTEPKAYSNAMKFASNLMEGITYYKNLRLSDFTNFEDGLLKQESRLKNLLQTIESTSLNKTSV